MTYDQAISAIQVFFQSLNISDQVSYDDGPYKPEADTPWYRVSIKHFDGYQASVGGSTNRFRRAGLVTVQVFHPEGNNGIGAVQDADAIVNHFLGEDTQGIHFYDVQMREIGNDGAGWYQVNVLIYFRYDHTA